MMLMWNSLPLCLQSLIIISLAQSIQGSARDDFLRAHRNSRECEARGDGVFPDPQDCHFYYNCRNGVLSYSFRCPDGFVFHPTDRRCIAADDCVDHNNFKSSIVGTKQQSQPISVTNELSDKRQSQLDKFLLHDNNNFPSNATTLLIGGGGRNASGSQSIDGLINIESLTENQQNQKSFNDSITTQHFYHTTAPPAVEGHTAAQTYLLKVVFNRRQNDQFRTAFDSDGSSNPFAADLHPLPRFQPFVPSEVAPTTPVPFVPTLLPNVPNHVHFYNTNMSMNSSNEHLHNLTVNGSITVAAELKMSTNGSHLYLNQSTNANATLQNSTQSQFEFTTYDLSNSTSSNSTEQFGNSSTIIDSVNFFNWTNFNFTTNETDIVQIQNGTNGTTEGSTVPPTTAGFNFSTTPVNLNDLNSRNRVQLSEDSVKNPPASPDFFNQTEFNSTGANHTDLEHSHDSETAANLTNTTYTILFPPVQQPHTMLNETIRAIIGSSEATANTSEVLKATVEEDCKCQCARGNNVTSVPGPKTSPLPTGQLVPVCHNFPCFNAGMFFSINHGKECGCVCPPGYQGLHCEELVERSLCHCANGGKCVRVGNSTYTCQCPLGFIGGQCEHGVGEIENPFASVIQLPDGINPDRIHTDLNNIMICQTNICLNGGLCLKQLSNNKSRCYCTGSFGGDYCEKRFDRPLEA